MYRAIYGGIVVSFPTKIPEDNSKSPMFFPEEQYHLIKIIIPCRRTGIESEDVNKDWFFHTVVPGKK